MSDLLGLPCIHGEDATVCGVCWEGPFPCDRCGEPNADAPGALCQECWDSDDERDEDGS